MIGGPEKNWRARALSWGLIGGGEQFGGDAGRSAAKSGSASAGLPHPKRR
jgi:hypothetical protein